MNYQNEIELIKHALEVKNLFPVIDLYSSYEATNIRRFLQTKPISTLQSLFTTANLTPRIGYNFSTNQISLTFPTPCQPPIERNPGDLNSQRSIVLWTMLGMHDKQQEIERIFENSIANACIEIFALQTGVAILSRKFDFQQQTLRVSICPLREVRTVTGYDFFKYSPSYLKLNGYDRESKIFTEQTLEEQRLHLIMSMVDYFWTSMDKQKYLTNDYIKSELSNALVDYLESGIDLQSCHSALFHPKATTSLNLYLYGTAGIGKSSFIKAFRAAFEETLIRFVDPSQKVVIVKLPLNSLSPSHLLSILHIKGISDMSIERIIEQTLCKGHLVILHLEENPEEADLQCQLYHNIQVMLDKLTDRYSEYRSNVMCFYTSNYEPVAVIVASANILSMVPPSHISQLHWCERNLRDCIISNTSYQSLSIEFKNYKPPFSDDLRPLERWWRSVGFQIIKSLNNIDAVPIGEASSQSSINIIFRNGSKDSSSEFLIHISFGCTSLSSIYIKTTDTMFCYSDGEKHLEDHLARGRYVLPSKDSHFTFTTVVDMLVRSYIKPGIIVLTGDSAEKKLQCVEIIKSYLKYVFSDRLQETEVTLKEEKDKSKVFGEAGEILGGLFRFMDGVNNPNACGGKVDLYGVVVSFVNEVGQFILRELIESDPSKTHRQTAHKDRMLFVLVIDENSQLTPQLHSRAHSILTC